MKLATLTVSSLRGIPHDWPQVDIGDKGLVVYGANGVGKSSLIDAIEHILTGASTLYAENRAGVNWEVGAPHVRGGPFSMSVALRNGNEVYTVSTGTTVPPGAENWVGLARSASFVLRRYMLLRFVGAQPRDRYELIEPFLNLRGYLPLEAALKALADSVQTQYSEAAADLQAREQTLRRIFSIAATQSVSETALLDGLNANLAAAQLEQCSSMTELIERKGVVDLELGAPEKHLRLATLGGLKAQAQRLAPATTYKALADQFDEALRDFELKVAEHPQTPITDFLSRGKQILEARTVDECPLCEQSIESANVLSRLNERILADRRITDAKTLVEQRREASGQ